MARRQVLFTSLPFGRVSTPLLTYVRPAFSWVYHPLGAGTLGRMAIVGFNRHNSERKGPPVATVLSGSLVFVWGKPPDYLSHSSCFAKRSSRMVCLKPHPLSIGAPFP
jgi:hypothetical protein